MPIKKFNSWRKTLINDHKKDMKLKRLAEKYGNSIGSVSIIIKNKNKYLSLDRNKLNYKKISNK